MRGVPGRVRGTYDLLAEQCHIQQHIESVLTKHARLFDFRQTRTPILEPKSLFLRSLGQTSDVVLKEMFHVNDDTVLRPEGTAGLMRAALSGTRQSGGDRHYYCGPMFRHERSQKGRYRQFSQFGVEWLHEEQELSDVQVVHMAYQALRELGVADQVTLLINSLGDEHSRKEHHTLLHAFLRQHYDCLSEASQRRVDADHPLRVLDSKDNKDKAVCSQAPDLLSSLSSASRDRFQRVLEGLDVLGVPFRVEPTLVRGLDYYSHTAFEFVDAGGHLGPSQSAVLAGGRYDKLSTLIGHAQEVPGVGWAAGIERLALLIQASDAHDTLPPLPSPAAYIVQVPADHTPLCQQTALRVANCLRQWGMGTVLNGTLRKVKKQMAQASNSGAQLAIIVGAAECVRGEVTVKNLLTQRQLEVSLSSLESAASAAELRSRLGLP